MTPSAVHRLWARLLSWRKPAEALAQARLAVELDPADADSRLVLVGCLASGPHPQRQEALKQIREGFRLSQDSPHLAAGLLRLELQWPGSLPEAHQALLILGKSARTAQEYDVTARYLFREGKVAHAERFATKSIRIDPARPSAWVTLAQIVAHDGNYNRAIQLLSQALLLGGHGRDVEISKLIDRYRREAAKAPQKPAAVVSPVPTRPVAPPNGE
jgi:tetratricopeptide (TPR) repeat protein